MSSGAGRRPPAQAIETRTIQPIPAGQRHGRPRDLFTLWFGSNLMILTATHGKDYPMLEAGILTAGAAFILSSMLADALIALLDARTRMVRS